MGKIRNNKVYHLKMTLIRVALSIFEIQRSYIRGTIPSHTSSIDEFCADHVHSNHF